MGCLACCMVLHGFSRGARYLMFGFAVCLVARWACRVPLWMSMLLPTPCTEFLEFTFGWVALSCVTLISLALARALQGICWVYRGVPCISYGFALDPQGHPLFDVGLQGAWWPGGRAVCHFDLPCSCPSPATTFLSLLLAGWPCRVSL